MESTMKTFAIVLALSLVAAAAGAQSALPTISITPGVARPMTLTVICSTAWGKDARHVTLAMKKQVFAAYGIPYADHAQYEVDHLISRELGGADDVKNLWPEPWYIAVDGKESGAHQKDRVENATHKAVCAGSISLEEAQAQIVKDWTVLYRRFVGDFPAPAKR
jgi:hypothetical protein